MVKKILVRIPNWVGDGVMATASLARLRSNFKGAEITVLAKPTVAALLLHHPAIDRILVYEKPGKHAGPAGFLRLISHIRKERFDLAILLQNAFEAALIAYCAGIPERRGYDTDGRAFLLTSALPRKDATRHQRDAFLQIIPSDAGEPKATNGGCLPAVATSLHLREDEVWAAQNRLAPFGIVQGDFIVGISPGSAIGSAKRWLPERFAEVADRLIEKYQAKILLLGGPGDRKGAETVLYTMKHQATLLAGESSLREMMALISLCRLSLSNDSGPMHIASAFGIPYIAIFGSTEPTASFPGGRLGRVIYHGVNCSPCWLSVCPVNHHCMTSVSVQEVLVAAEEVINVGIKDSH